MIDKNLIYRKASLEEEIHGRRAFYKGLDEKYYEIKVSEIRVEIFCASSVYENFKRAIGVMRIYPDDDMVEIMALCLKALIDDTSAYMSTYRDPNHHAAFVRGTLGRNLGKRQIENLCIMFYETVRIGDSSLDFSELIKDVLKIHAMPVSAGILPGFHDLLLKVPDVYYDFMVEMERSTERNQYVQRRCMNFLENHPNAKCSDVVIYASMLNADNSYIDEWMEKVIRLVNYDDSFAIYDVKHGLNEIIRVDNKHDWHIFDVILGNRRSYTFRQVKSLVFADFRNVCFRAAMVSKVGDDLAMIHDVAESSIPEEGVYEGLISYLEKLVLAGGVHNISAFVKEEHISLYEELGYELCEDELIDNPYEDYAERSFMWKKLTEEVYA
ncbi:MAG: hypothetical protein MJ097_08370 [Dorea sp.]|nr:hypothetical protein [Dorea sp.]